MTPEHAHELGKLAADQMLTDAIGPSVDGTASSIMREMDFSADHHAPRDGAGFVAAFKAMFLRGAAEHFREIASAIDERAASIEVTR